MAATVLAAASLISIAGAFAQTITPPSIVLPAASPVCSGASVEQEACIEFPPAATVRKVDVFFLLDDTGSFSDVAVTIGMLFEQLVTDLETALPGIEFGFGVGRFEDYGGPGNLFSQPSQPVVGPPEDPKGRPFILDQPSRDVGRCRRSAGCTQQADHRGAGHARRPATAATARGGSRRALPGRHGPDSTVTATARRRGRVAHSSAGSLAARR